VFFAGATSLDIEPFLRQVPNLEDAILTIIGAKTQGASVPSDWLLSVVETANRSKVWQEYAWLGPTEARQVWENFSQVNHWFVPALLYYIPELAIQSLFNEAIGDNRRLNSSSNHPVRIIEDWVNGDRHERQNAGKRREILYREAQKWLNDGKDIKVILSIIPIILSPSLVINELDPGSGMRLSIFPGMLTVNEMMKVQALWPLLLTAIGVEIFSDWEKLRDLLDAWVYSMTQITLPNEVLELKHIFATTLIRDLVPLAPAHPGILHRLAHYSLRGNVDVEVPIDLDFETLYPEDLESGGPTAEQIETVRELALQWSQDEPGVALQRVSFIEWEAESVGGCWPRLTPDLCEHIATSVDVSTPWLKAAMEVKLAPDLVIPFLTKAMKQEEAGWVDLALDCLKDPSLRVGAVCLALTKPSVPPAVLDLALQYLEGYENLVQTRCLRNEITGDVLQRLLTHPNISIARAAVIGIWWAGNQTIFPESLRPQCEKVIIEWTDRLSSSRDQSYILENILKTDTQLLFRWLKAKLSESDPPFVTHENFFSFAAALDDDQKRSIINDLPVNLNGCILLPHLIGNNLSLFRELLGNQRLQKLHLLPLQTDIFDSAWIEKAQLALKAGYDAQTIGRNSYQTLPHFSGKMSDLWKGWIERFEELETQQVEAIREIGFIGKNGSTQQYRDALKQERDAAIYGFN